MKRAFFFLFFLSLSRNSFSEDVRGDTFSRSGDYILYSERCRCVRSPECYHKLSSDPLSVFLSGPSSTFWRQDLMDLLRFEALVLLDPTLAFKKNNRFFQVTWEHDHIDKSDVILVWLPEEESLNSAFHSLETLFELGRFVEMRDKILVLGIHPNYPQREELELQVKKLRRDVPIVDSLEGVVGSLKELADHKGKRRTNS